MPPRKEDNVPKWRLVLEWGCVVYFLGIPLISIVTIFTPLVADFEKYPESRENLVRFHLAVSGLVATIAGLNTVDRKVRTKG
jgi:hypothetical protein